MPKLRNLQEKKQCPHCKKYMFVDVTQVDAEYYPADEGYFTIEVEKFTNGN